MSSGSSNRTNTHHPSSLLLRALGPDGHADELYLASGLSIGRSVANAVVLADDDSVDRTHARVEVADDGTMCLRCIEPESSLTVGVQAVRELPLNAGVRFRIGRTEFECLPGRRAAVREPSNAETCCPFCESVDDCWNGDDMRECSVCQRPILPVWPDPAGQHPLVVPAIYGDYTAEHYVAKGGMGLVLKGSRTAGGGPVAIKLLLQGMNPDPKATERFEREVAMMARVQHPNVVKLLDHGKSGRFHFLALEWIDGFTLRRVLAKTTKGGKQVDFKIGFRWFEQVCKGLSAIQAAGLVHRDIKPSNILIGRDGNVRIADMGIAKRTDLGQTAYTTTGHAPGTFEYMAPEQFSAPDTVDRRPTYLRWG